MDARKEIEFVLADLEELEWTAKHGYKYDRHVLLGLRRQHRLLYTKLKEFVLKVVKRMMKDHKRDFDTLIEQINKGLTKHLKNETKGGIQKS